MCAFGNERTTLIKIKIETKSGNKQKKKKKINLFVAKHAL